MGKCGIPWKGWCIKLPEKDSFVVATVANVSALGVTLLLPGSDAPTQKRYRRLAIGQSLEAGDLVLCARASGTLVILGRITVFD